jgi:hypothetical protein
MHSVALIPFLPTMYVYQDAQESLDVRMGRMEGLRLSDSETDTFFEVGVSMLEELSIRTSPLTISYVSIYV